MFTAHEQSPRNSLLCECIQRNHNKDSLSTWAKKLAYEERARQTYIAEKNNKAEKRTEENNDKQMKWKLEKNLPWNTKTKFCYKKVI